MQDFSLVQAYLTPVNPRIIPILAAACLLLTGCHHDTNSAPAPASSPADQSAAANALFLNQKTFDPWVLSTTDQSRLVNPYFSDGRIGCQITASGHSGESHAAGDYKDGQLATYPPLIAGTLSPGPQYRQALDLRSGQFSTSMQGTQAAFPLPDDNLHFHPADWPHLWQTSDIIIQGDPEAQQVTHANLFYLLSSTYPGSDHSIPPFGLSSNLYGGHIFWDAEVWMMPALIVQHPDYAKSIIAYRFKLLGQAKKNAKQHGFAGAEYPWESAGTGEEMVGGEFTKERHITADVGWAAWQYYLWTGDKAYLKSMGWPVLSATAQYWVSRVTKSADGKYHVKGVVSPDETAGVVDDDAWTNAVVQANLQAATRAAITLGQPTDPRWKTIAGGMYFPFDKPRGIPAENDTTLTDRFAAKQADTLLLVHPLNVPFDAQTEGKMLDFYTAARFQQVRPGNDGQHSRRRRRPAGPRSRNQSGPLPRRSYRPFMRGPWDALCGETHGGGKPRLLLHRHGRVPAKRPVRLRGPASGRSRARSADRERRSRARARRRCMRPRTCRRGGAG